jgi:hypothetical protein
MTKKQTENIRYFKGIWMPKNIYLNNNLNWTEKILLVEIDSLDDGRGCFASNKYFAEFLGVTQRSITAAIAKLKKLKLVEQICFNGKIRTLKSNLNRQNQGEEEIKNNKVKEKKEKEEKIKETEEKINDNTEKNEVKKEIKEKTKKEENDALTKNSLEVYFHSAPKFTSSLPRSKLLGSIYSINNTNNNTNNNIINNKKDKSFLEKEDSFSNQNLKSLHDFSFRNDLDLGRSKIDETEENDEKALNLKDNEISEKNKTNEKDLKEDLKEETKEETERLKQKTEETNKEEEQIKEQIPNQKHLRKQIFGFGTMLLNKSGQTDQESRRIIGKWLKTNKETDVFKFIKQSLLENIVDPVSWITKQLEKQNILFQENKKKEIQNKYNGRKEELEEEYQRTHNGEYNEAKVIDCFYPELKSIRLKLDKYNKWERSGQPIIDLELMDKLTEEERQIVFSYEEYKELRKEWGIKNKEKEEKEKKKYEEIKRAEKNNGDNDDNRNNSLNNNVNNSLSNNNGDHDKQ